MTVSVLVDRFKNHAGTVVGLGMLDDGRRVAFAPDRQTYIMAAPLLAAGGPVGVEIDDWRVIETRPAGGMSSDG